MSAPAKRMLTADEAAEYCGFKSVNGFRSHVSVSPVNFGSNVRYDKEALDEYLDTLRQSQPARGFGEMEDAGSGRGH